MQRLRPPRPRDERGAVAVVIAFTLVILVGFAALAVDVGALWWDRKQLQNGADAAALAVAQECAAGASCPTGNGSSSAYATADAYALGNKTDANASAFSVEVEGTTVTVTTTSDRDAWFSRLWTPSNTVNAQASAQWLKNPGKLITVPLAVSQCQFLWQSGYASGDPKEVAAGFELTIDLLTTGQLPKTEQATVCPDDPPQGNSNPIPGSFGYLDPIDGDTCLAEVTVGDDIVSAKPGNLPCDFGIEVGDIIVVPLFDAAWGNGSNAQYHISGFAALEVTDFKLQGVGNSFIQGVFVKYGTLEEWPTATGGTDFGVSFVRLVDVDD